MTDSEYKKEEDQRIQELGDQAKSCQRNRVGPQIQRPDASQQDIFPLNGEFLRHVYPGANGKTRKDLFPTEVVAVPDGQHSEECLRKALAGKSHEEILRGSIEEKISSESVRELNTVLPHSQRSHVDRRDASYWGSTEGIAYPMSSSVLDGHVSACPADVFAETLEESYDGVRIHKGYTITFAETAKVPRQATDTIELDDLNLGANPEGKSERYSIKNGRGIGANQKDNREHLSHESYLIVQINKEGKAPKHDEEYVELRYPLAATMPDSALPIPAPPIRDGYKDHVRVQEELAKKTEGNVGYDQEGNTKWIELGAEKPQFTARVPDNNIMLQPKALRREHVLSTKVVDYSVPAIKDKMVANIEQAEVREVRVNIHPGSRLAIAVINATCKAKHVSAVNFTTEIFAQGARAAIDDMPDSDVIKAWHAELAGEYTRLSTS